MTIKVSVVVAAYQPGDGIDRVIGSLDAQTLPQDEFETIIIDDGSPDDTFARLQTIQQTHPNLVIDRIENSGWPSRPRNIGLDRARGEYVLFMDHDDFIYPNGLRRTYEFGAANDADVISPKESKTTDVAWGIDNYTENVPNARETRGIASLLPMMPHKLYRREFLNEHGIRFPEGRRMLWEDVYFNVEAYRHASVISILSDTPVYKWVHTGSNNSSTYGPGNEEFWDKLDRLFAFIERTLPGEEFRDARETMLVHQYRTRVMGRFYKWLGDNDEAILDAALTRVRAIIERHVPESLDVKLGKLAQVQSALLRHGDVELMRRLKAIDRDVIGLARTERVEWADGKLHIDLDAVWDGFESARMPLQRQGDRILRRLPADIAAIVPESAIDLTEDVQRASSRPSIRSRHDHVTWLLPAEQKLRIVDVAGAETDAVRLEVASRAVVDPETAAMSGPRSAPVWDLHARNKFAGATNQRALRTTTRPRVAFIDGTVAIAYRNASGHLSLDLAQAVRSALRDAGPALHDVAVSRVRGREYEFSIRLTDAHIVGRTELSGQIELHPTWLDASTRFARKVARRLRVPFPEPPRPKPTAVRLVADENGATLTGRIRAGVGSYLLTTRFDHDVAVTALNLRATVSGRLEFSALS